MDAESAAPEILGYFLLVFLVDVHAFLVQFRHLGSLGEALVRTAAHYYCIHEEFVEE